MLNINLKLRSNTMKRFYIHHKGLVYGVHEYANSKREAVANYRYRWNLVGKHITFKYGKCK